MKKLKTKLFVLAIAAAAGSIACAIHKEDANIAMIGILAAATYGAVAMSIKVKTA